MNMPIMPPHLAVALREVAHQFAERRRVRARIAFGVATLAFLAAGTAALVWANAAHPDLRNWIILSFVVAESVAAWYWLRYRAHQSIPLKELALHIDAMHPELHNRIVSTVEFARLDKENLRDPSDAGAVSSWMIQRLLEDTDLVTRTTPIDDVVNPRAIAWASVFSMALLIAGAATLLYFGSLWLPDLSFARISNGGSTVDRIPLKVTPGNAEVRYGDTAIILVEAAEPVTDAAIAFGRPGDEPAVEALTAGADPKVWHHVFKNVREDIEYRVQAGRDQSETFRITTWTPPRSDAVHLRYTYPEYLNRPDEELRNSGPISAVVGTRVRVEVDVNKKLKEAALVLDNGTEIPLSESTDATWSGELVVESSGDYHVRLADASGHTNEYQPRYPITAIEDTPPAVRISFPRGDDEVTALEEIPFAFEVTDDFGLAAYGIQYEIAGREPVRVALSADDMERALSAGGEHFLALEQLNLTPGDLVTWTVWARDVKPDRDQYAELGDPFFLEVRPYRRTFTEAVSNAGANQQQNAQQQSGSESMEQKQVLIATWNLRRSLAKLSDEEFLTKRNTIMEAQTKLLESSQEDHGQASILELIQPEELVPGEDLEGGEKPLPDRLIEAQQKVIDTLAAAEMPAPGDALSEAMKHEQEAYSLLMKLESTEQSLQMAMNMPGAQGAQGQRSGAAQREIDHLELDLNRNFYEEEQTTQSTAQQRANEDTLAALKELIQRQQLANEEMSKLISELQQAKTEEERAEIERRLKRLEEEMQNNIESLDQLSGQMASGEMESEQASEARESLDSARNDMNRSLENLRDERLQEARAAGTRAGNQLDEMQQQLAGLSGGSAEENLRELTHQMDELGERQEKVIEQLQQLAKNEETKSLDNIHDENQIQEKLIAEKEAMARDFEQLIQDATNLAEGTRESQELLSRKLNDWLRETGERDIAESMRRTAPYINYGIWDPLIDAEEQTAQSMRASAERLKGVGDFRVEDDLDALRMARDEIERLLDGSGRTAEDERQQSDSGQTPGSELAESQEGEAGVPQPGPQQTRQPGDEQQPAEQQQPGEEQGGPGAGGYSPENIEEFIARDYGRWLDAIRDAESLLPNDVENLRDTSDGSARQRLRQVRETIGGMRRDYRGDGEPPKYDLFLEHVIQPLVEAAADIDATLRDKMRQDEFALTQEADVPVQFKDNVATYFRLLSEAAASGN